MRNLEYVFCTLVGISSIPNTLLAGQAQPRKKADQQATTEHHSDCSR